jgi:hypothetical protein
LRAPSDTQLCSLSQSGLQPVGAGDQPPAAKAGDVIVPQQNPYGIGSKQTRVKLYSAGDDSFEPISPGTTNATHWIVTINGVNYQGTTQD